MPSLLPAPRAQTVQTVDMPAPVGGINAITPGRGMPPTDCVLLYNMTASELGLRARLGYREWVTGLTGASDDLVRSVLPFSGSVAAGTEDKLFATTSSGIWDVTSSTDSPSLAIAFADTTGQAGYGVSHAMVTSAGHYLLYCDEVNGLYVYTESGGTWAKVAMGGGGSEISNVDPADFVSLKVHKGRVWFVEKNSANAWYLAAGSIFGAATKFNFGQQFKSGGGLRGLWSWTYDGGAGLDDSLVAVSDGGDVAIYQGDDPASASTWEIRGVWFTGGVPAGRHLARDRGGELLLITRGGLLPLGRLTNGGSIDDPKQYASYKVAPIFNQLMLTQSQLMGWSVREHPEDNTLVVTVPAGEGVATIQLAASMSGASWSQYRDLPIFSSEVWQGKLYFGTVDGRVCINDGYVDGVTLADSNVYTPVQWSLLTSFQAFGSSRKKLVRRIRPTILSDSARPNYAAKARFDFDLSEALAVAGGTSGGSGWDGGLWDAAVWGGDLVPSVSGAVSQRFDGRKLIGSSVAIALRGTAVGRLVLAGIEVFYEEGGVI